MLSNVSSDVFSPRTTSRSFMIGTGLKSSQRWKLIVSSSNQLEEMQASKVLLSLQFGADVGKTQRRCVSCNQCVTKLTRLHNDGEWKQRTLLLPPRLAQRVFAWHRCSRLWPQQRDQNASQHRLDWWLFWCETWCRRRTSSDPSKDKSCW